MTRKNKRQGGFFLVGSFKEEQECDTFDISLLENRSVLFRFVSFQCCTSSTRERESY